MTTSRRRGCGPAAALTVFALLASACGAAAPTGTSSRAAGGGQAGGQTGGAQTAGADRTAPLDLVAAPASWSLPSPLTRPVALDYRGRILLLGGLTRADQSTAAIEEINPASGAVTTRGQLATAVHDAAGAVIGGSAVVFGGGAFSTIDDVQSWAGGTARVVAHLPQPRSDLTAADVGNTAYVIGGFTGSSLPGAILATTDGLHFRVVGELVQPVRYPAVTADGRGRIWITGGELGTAEGAESGGQTDDIQRFDPATGRTTLVSHLPETLGHASAFFLGDQVFVAGGRHLTTPSAAVFRVDPATGAVARAGTLPQPRSDAGAVVIGATGYLLGGEEAQPTSALSSVETVRAERDGAAVTAGPAATSKSRAGGAGAAQTTNIYAADGPNMLSPKVRNMPYRIYVPESAGESVDVIDPHTYRVIDRYVTGLDPQHVVPAWNLETLYAANDEGNSLTPISPYTGKPEGPDIPVEDPYNMYFTPDGRSAIVVEEARQTLAFRNPRTFALQKALAVDCAGIDHADFSADGTFAIFSCEFSGKLVKVDLGTRSVVSYLSLPGSSPQDVKLDSAGRVFYVADMNHGGVWMISAATFRSIGFLATGRDAHGLYVSRNGRDMYVTNRGAGSISVIDLASRRVAVTWHIPGGGSPDMGNLSPDGKVLWVSGRYNACVYAISTVDGHLIAKIPVPNEPHGLAVWPQPGRYSLGHTGIMR